ncbi:hypothetical protein TRFO_23429 [Tritrichomonas foetus]|uniref:Uncharacterized protein n=1 Tax=Tritrichomonas foetus TaxID=1144522 RepID=A0A1J4KEI6_9EUKA|nr:hypothetical protein TRFO_23429 [Tritrichomonas foetus]|eukprot:OHT08148.1 hypothetical protein TRFO_23429 [Tritrichomonas foetus]
MDTSSAIRICLLLLGFAFITNLVGAYTVVGVICCKAINYICGVVLLGLVAYVCFFIYKASEKSMIQKVILGTIAALILAGSISCFARAKYITQYSKIERFFLSLFVSLAIYSSIGLFWPQIILRFCSNIMQAFDADFLQIVSFGMNAVSAVICSLFLLIPTEYNENFFLNKASIYTIATVVINSVWSMAFGFALQFKAESGYASQI